MGKNVALKDDTSYKVPYMGFWEQYERVQASKAVHV